MIDTSLEMRRAKLFTTQLFVFRVCFNFLCRPVLFLARSPISRICSYSLRISFTRTPNLLLISSHLVYPQPESALISSHLVYSHLEPALNPFVSRLPASRICSYLSHLVHSHPVSASKLYPVQKSSKMLE